MYILEIEEKLLVRKVCCVAVSLLNVNLPPVIPIWNHPRFSPLHKCQSHASHMTVMWCTHSKMVKTYEWCHQQNREGREPSRNRRQWWRGGWGPPPCSQARWWIPLDWLRAWQTAWPPHGTAQASCCPVYACVGVQRLTGMMCGNTAGAVGHKYLPSYSELNDYSTVHISNLQLESCDTHLSHVTPTWVMWPHTWIMWPHTHL